MFENLKSEPITKRSYGDKMKILSSQLFVSRGDSSLFLDSLEEILDVAAMLIVTSVKWPGISSVSLRWNTAFHPALGKKLPELIRVVGFVSENCSTRKAIDEFEGPDQIVAIPGCTKDSKHATGPIDQRMDLSVRSAPRMPDLLFFRALWASKGMFVDFHAGRIDRPQFAFESSSKEDMDFIPDTEVAPFSPSSVNRSVRGENTERPPTATFTKTKEDCVKYRFRSNRLPSSLSPPGLVGRTRIDQMNFFSSLATRRSFLWMRISGIRYFSLY